MTTTRFVMRKDARKHLPPPGGIHPEAEARRHDLPAQRERGFWKQVARPGRTPHRTGRPRGR